MKNDNKELIERLWNGVRWDERAELAREAAIALTKADAITEAMYKVRLRAMFMGTPGESHWQPCEGGKWIPDWRYEFQLMEHVLHGSDITTPEKPTDTKPAHEVVKSKEEYDLDYQALEELFERWKINANIIPSPNPAAQARRGGIQDCLAELEQAMPKKKETQVSPVFEYMNQKVAEDMAPFRATLRETDDQKSAREAEDKFFTVYPYLPGVPVRCGSEPCLYDILVHYYEQAFSSVESLEKANKYVAAWVEKSRD